MEPTQNEERMTTTREMRMLVWGLMEWMRPRQRRSLMENKGTTVRRRLKAAGFQYLCQECLLPCGENGREQDKCPDCYRGRLERL